MASRLSSVAKRPSHSFSWLASWVVSITCSVAAGNGPQAQTQLLQQRPFVRRQSEFLAMHVGHTPSDHVHLQSGLIVAQHRINAPKHLSEDETEFRRAERYRRR